MKNTLQTGSLAIVLALTTALAAILPVGCGKESAAPEGAIRPDQFQQQEQVLVEGAEPGRWTQDLRAAEKLAAEMKLPLFLNFTGSDWCPPCQMMHKKVFSKPAWQSYAATHFILVHIDFPTDPSLVPEKYRNRNKELQAKWQVQGYPTFVILHPDGKRELGRLGAVQDASAEQFIQRVDAVLSGETETHPQAAATLPVTDVTPRVGAGHRIDPMQTGAAIGRWTEDLNAARKLAAQTRRPMLFFFTGSDWCEACAAARQRILNRANFQRYAKNNLVQVVIDFPREKAQDPKRKERNERLASKYHVIAYPTFLLFAPDGATLAGAVPMANSPHEFRQNVEEAANLLPSEIDAVASALGGPAGERYRKLAADLVKARREHRVLMNEARRLQSVGGLTPEFRDNLQASMETVNKLESETIKLRNQVYAAKLPPLIARKYTRLQEQLETATQNYRKWLMNPTGSPEEQAARRMEHQTTINNILTAIDDIEAEQRMRGMNEEDAEAYRRLRERLGKIRETFQTWLQSQPEKSEENNRKYSRFMQQIQKLQDELDALRDGV